MTGHGVSSRSSHSAAAGRTTSAANWWTQSRTSITSSLGSREKVMPSSFAVSRRIGLGLLWRTERADGLEYPRLEEPIVVDVARGMASQGPKGGGVSQ